MNPHHLNIYWQIPDGIQILGGHFPTTVSYAIASGPLVEQEWLFEVALAWAVSHGAFGAFAILCGLFAAATPLLTYVLVRSFGVSRDAAAVAATLTTGARFLASGVRPETIAVDTFAVLLIVLARERGTLWIVPTMILWANVHASATIAPFVAAAVAIAYAIGDRGSSARARRASFVATIALVATFASPNGSKLWTYAIGLALGSNPARQHLDVWKPLNFDTIGDVSTVLPGLLLLACCGIVFSRRYIYEIGSAATFFALTLLHQRYGVFLVVAWAPMIGRSLEARRWALALTYRPPFVAALIALVPFFMCATIYGVKAAADGPDSAGDYRAAAGIVAEHGFRGNVYAPYVWAAYLHWRELPVRLLIDAHGDPYPPDVWNDHLSLENLRSNWRDVLRRRHITLVVIPVASPLAQALAIERSWHRVEVRGDIAAFERHARSRSDSARRPAITEAIGVLTRLPVRDRCHAELPRPAR